MTKPCAWVDNMISVETDGWTRPCCGETGDAARISQIDRGIKTAFNHPKLLELKKNLDTEGYSDKTNHTCYRCTQLENKNHDSLRTQTTRLSEKRELKAIQFKMSNKCQLTCAHCGPDRSSSWRKYLGISPHVIESFTPTDDFLSELAELLPNLDYIKFTGGEPFLDPAHYKILEFLSNYDRSHCKLIYITNGLVKPRLDLWQGWKEIECSISIEGHGPTYEWFRRGATWDEINDSVPFIRRHSISSISYSITPWTIADFTVSRDYWNMPIYPFAVVYPTRASINNIPQQIATRYWNGQPFAELATGAGRLEIYKNYANEWDTKWNTPGLAEQLYPWLCEHA
jgi:hypothetical protein